MEKNWHQTADAFMNNIHIEAKKDFLASLTSARPIAAIAELLWNGLDAESNHLRVILELNSMNGLQTIRVQDYGKGIPHDEVSILFGNLGESWKKKKARVNGRALHGKNGKGRFKAFALGSLVEWRTTVRHNGAAYSYKIIGNMDSLDTFQFSEPISANGAITGTEVEITNLHHEFGSLLNEENTSHELAKIFAAYLSQYPEVYIEYNRAKIDPSSVQVFTKEYHLGDVPIGNGNSVPVAVSIIEWATPTKRAIHLCDGSGVALHDVEAGQQIRAPGFHFTAYVRSDHFRELDKENKLILEDLHPEVDSILRPAKSKIKEHFRRRLVEEQSHIIRRWKEEDIYPYQDKITLDPVEEVERQVFDILAINVQSYLPDFDEADTKSRKFTFRLLAQAIRQNPDSVQEIIGEVLGLKKEEQDSLAELLKKTPLSSIISSAKIVANRLDFLVGLENLLFDKETKKVMVERDQLHKILSKESWLLDEHFALAGSEQRLEEVLAKHLDKLGPREDDQPVKLSDGKQGRIDLMFAKVVQPRTGQYDYLIVELKRPSKKIDDQVITQIKKYARAVASDERFHQIPARWTFIAISNELDEFAKGEANQRHRPSGMIDDHAELNITVWVKEWAEVINDARARLHFINSQLSYEADRDSATGYLREAHAKFIPDITSGGTSAINGKDASLVGTLHV